MPDFLRHIQGMFRSRLSIGNLVSPIGCSLFGGRVRLVQHQHGELVWGESELALADDDFNTDCASWAASARRGVSEALEQAEFVGRSVVSCMPTEQLELRRLLMAPMGDHELAEAVRWQALDGLDSSEQAKFACDFYDAGMTLERGKKRREVIAVTARCDKIHVILDVLSEASLAPLAIDTPYAAFARVLDFAFGDSESAAPRLVLLVESERLTLCVVRLGSPVFVMQHDLGAEAFDPGDPATRFRDPSSPALTDTAKQISTCVHYLEERAEGPGPPRSGCVVGAGACESLMIEALNARTPVRFEPLIESVSPAHRSLLDAFRNDPHADRWLVPAGLARYEAAPKQARRAA